ncbi:MAG: hypothetical protein AAFN81_35510, partial [Bacteroidota bacterium]
VTRDYLCRKSRQAGSGSCRALFHRQLPASHRRAKLNPITRGLIPRVTWSTRYPRRTASAARSPVVIRD